MPFYTLYQIKQDVSANMPGNGISQLTDFFATFDKGRRAMLGKVRPEELIRSTYLEDAFYPNVDQYSVPDDMKYDDVIQIKRLAGYRNVDTLEHPLELVYRRRFGQKRGSAANVMNIGYLNGTKYARLFRPAGSRYPVNTQSNPTTFLCIQDCSSLNENGIWNVGGNVVNLREDHLNHITGRGSLWFDINGSATEGFLENFSLTEFNLINFLNQGAVFNWLDIGLPKELTSVKFVMGSDSTDRSTNYYYSTVNAPHDNNQFQKGWNLLKYMLNSLSWVGTPNPGALTWIRLEFTTTGQPIPSCHLDGIVARKGTVYEMEYNSSYVVRDANTGVWKKIPNDNNDIIIAEEDTYNLLVAETTVAAMREAYMAGPAANNSLADFSVQLIDMYRKFKMEHKSEAMSEIESEHIFGNMYDGYTDDPEDGFGNQYGQWGDGAAPQTGAFGA